MHINFYGQIEDQPEIRAGVIGCGSHSFRNVYPTFQFAPVDLVATCDLDADKARAFARAFGAKSSYTDYREMLAREELDAVFIVTGYDAKGRPLYPDLTVECLRAGVHVWIEKPPAASTADIERMQAASRETGKHVIVGLKKMFFPANEKVKELMDAESFGSPQLALLQYPQRIPTVDELAAYAAGERTMAAISFLDHLCHPVSLLVFLLGMPASLAYVRSSHGAGVATFTYSSGAVGSIAFTHGQSQNQGMERTCIVSDQRQQQHITVENNVRVTLHRTPPGLAYGAAPSFYTGGTQDVSATWEPEFSLGNLYNKGLFLLGYYNEVNEFARVVLENRAPKKGTLEQAWQVTRIFEAFAEGPGQTIPLPEVQPASRSFLN